MKREKPDGLGYKPCLSFSRDYRRASEGVLKDRRKYLMVVVSGGLNQQRNQIVDAVVIARILGAALVVPILQVNVIWGDERYYILFLSLIYVESYFQIHSWFRLLMNSNSYNLDKIFSYV